MKRLSVVLLVLAMVLGEFSYSFAGPYFSGNIGAGWVEDSNFSESADGISVDGDISFDTGYVLSAAYGFSFYDTERRSRRSRRNTNNGGVRAEIEISYRMNDMDELDATINDSGTVISGKIGIDGDVTTKALMANVFYDFMTRGTISPFIGGGIGYANVEGDIDEFGDDDDNVFAYQGIAGVAFTLNQQMKLDVQYRYFTTDDPTLGGEDFEYVSHNAMIGVRYNF